MSQKTNIPNYFIFSESFYLPQLEYCVFLTVLLSQYILNERTAQAALHNVLYAAEGRMYHYNERSELFLISRRKTYIVSFWVLITRYTCITSETTVISREKYTHVGSVFRQDKLINNTEQQRKEAGSVIWV